LTLAPGIDDEHATKAFRRTAGGWENASTHPNIVSIYDRNDEPRPWIAVADVVGQPLDVVQPDLSLAETKTVISDVAEALRNAVLYNTHHLDLKPNHIWVVPDEEGVTGLVDEWGLERAVRAALNKPDVTPFTAPEIVEHPGAGGEQTDVYGLGALAYFALTGQPPITGHADLSSAIIAGDIPQLTDVDGSVLPAVDEIVMKALATNPAARPDSAYSFKQSFRQAATSVIQDDDEPADGVTGGAVSQDTEQTDMRARSGDDSTVSRRTTLGILGAGVVGIGGGWMAAQIGGDSDDESMTALDSTSISDVTPTKTSSGGSFSDEFDDNTYSDVWRVPQGDSSDDEIISETGGKLIHASEKSYNNGATLRTIESLSAEGTKRIEVEMRSRLTDYWGYGFGILFGEGGRLQLQEHKWEGFDRFGVSGVESHPPEYDSDYDDNYEDYDDTHFARVDSATTSTEFTPYSMTVDFDSGKIVSISRADDTSELNLRSSSNTYQITIGDGRGHEVEYKYIRVYSE